MRARFGRSLVVGAVIVAMSVVGVANAVEPLPTFRTSMAAGGSLNQTRPSIDGAWFAYQARNSLVMPSYSNVVFTNFDTHDNVTIGGGDSASQTNPDVSQGRVVYEDDTAGNGDVRMYDSALALDMVIANTADDEVGPRICGNLVAWHDADTDDILWRDLATGHSGNVPDAANVTYFDVDNGRIAWSDALVTQNVYVFDPHTSATSRKVFTAQSGDDIASLEMHGDWVVLTLDHGTTTTAYRLNTQGQNGWMMLNGTLNPTLFHDTVVTQFDDGAQSDLRWYQTEGTAGAVVEGPVNETNPSMFGRRILYEHETGILNDDIYMATSTPAASRTEGADRYLTAVEAAKAYFQESQYAVLCTGANFPDALAAGPFARLLRAPLLLTRTNTVPTEVMDELNHLAVQTVYIVGGTGVVSDAVKSQLQTAGYGVVRISGATRYDTAAEIADYMDEALGTFPGNPHIAFFARGDNFPDALAVGPVAAGALCPILLVKPNELPTSVADFIDTNNHFTSGVFVGGPDVVSTAVQSEVDAILEGNGGDQHPSERWYGDDRYATALSVLDHGTEYHWIDLDTLGVATGLNFPDALGGGAALGVYGSGLLLVRDYAPSTVTTWVAAHKNSIGRIDVFGGSDVVPESVKTQLHDLIK